MSGVAIRMTVGADESPKQPFWARCGDCGHCWTVCYLPMDMGKAAKLMSKAACPLGCSGTAFVAKQDNGVLREQTPAILTEIDRVNDTEDDQRCRDCGFLACICFDDDDRLDDEDGADDCMMGPDGYCGAAGSEWCDWECPLHNSYFGKALGS